MMPNEIESWLRKGREDVVKIFDLSPNWWPNGGQQAYASAWATAVFVNAAHDRCSASHLIACCNAGRGGICKRVIDELWADGRVRSHSPYEVLVDFSVHNWEASSPVQITGESEMHGRHGVGLSMEGEDDYSWDFYKLLVIPSVTRLFMARVEGKDGTSASRRAQQLAQSLASLVDWYAPALLRPHDELGIVILPAAKQESTQTIVMWLERGRLHRKALSKPLLPD